MIQHLEEARRRLTEGVFIGAALLGISSAACGGDGTVSRDEGLPSPFALKSALVDESVWELVPNPPKVRRGANPPDLSKMDDAMREALRQEAEDDPTWRAADGTRYEVMMRAADGRFYGRKGPARTAPTPNESNRYGASGYISEEGMRALNEVAPQGEKTRIGTDFTADDRLRQSLTAVLTTYPFRMVGPLHNTPAGAAQDGGCTATKIGPRTLLTASHCLFDDNGWFLPGRWNPGQSATTAHNGNFFYNVAAGRDYRLGGEWDYGVIAVDDSVAIANIPWEGINWWNSASSYNNLSTNLAGYPCGGNNGCGFPTVQQCKWSPEPDHRCNGWLYSHNASLVTADIQGDQMSMPHDCSSGQSGSSLWWVSGGSVVALGVWTHSFGDGICRGPRARQNFWDDVCSWIAGSPSAHATHSLCF